MFRNNCALTFYYKLKTLYLHSVHTMQFLISDCKNMLEPKPEYPVIKVIYLALIILCFIFINQASAQYQIEKSVIANGGNYSSGGTFQLSASIGEVGADQSVTGEGFELTGGFWQENTDLIFVNSFE